MHPTPPAATQDIARRSLGFRTAQRPILAACLMGTFLALLLPAYSGPDELGHIAYIAALAHGRLPTIPVGAVADIATGTTWQGQHPPLFYLLATPLYLLAGKNPMAALYGIRLLCVGMLAITVALSHRLASLFLTPGYATATAWIVALHPTVVYVCAMANNEALATALSLACVWSAVNANSIAEADTRKRRMWLVLTIVLGGLGLLTKLTAIAGVCAATYIAGHNHARRIALPRGLAILAGAIAIWLPWGLTMYRLHGAFVPSPVPNPAFTDGLWAFTLYPHSVFIVVVVATAQFAVGLIDPYWLVAPYPSTYYPMLIAGWSITIWTLIIAARQPKWRFVGVGFAASAVLVVSQVLFRDQGAILFLSRYAPTVAVLAAPMVVDAGSRLSPRTRSTAMAIWGIAVLATFAYILYFFFVGPSVSTVAPK